MKNRTLFLLSSIISSSIIFSCGSGENLSFPDSEESEIVSENTGFHYQGRACSECHSGNAGSVVDDDKKSFNIGGTVFKSLKAQDGDVNNAALNYYVVLKTDTGSTYRANVGRGTGNFNLNLPINSKFIPQIYNSKGILVNKSSSYHLPNYTDCNSCHTVAGKNGVPGRIVAFNYYKGSNQNNNTGNGSNNGNTGSSTNNPPVISNFTATPSSGQAPLQVSFICSAYDTDGGINRYEFDFNSDGIVDANNTTGIVSYTYNTNGSFTAKCTAYDNQGLSVSKTVQITVGNPNNTGNQNNSGGNGNTQPATITYTNDVLPILQSTGCTGCHGWASNYQQVLTKIDTANPSNSLLLLKATNSVSHGGGQKFTTNSPEYQTILNWIQQGANQ